MCLQFLQCCFFSEFGFVYSDRPSVKIIYGNFHDDVSLPDGQ